MGAGLGDDALDGLGSVLGTATLEVWRECDGFGGIAEACVEADGDITNTEYRLYMRLMFA